MFQIENENETPIKSTDYQNKNKHFLNPDNIQEITNYTEQELQENSSPNNMHQNTF